VRFAPSPTGYLHVGSAQSALFNWLHARHTGGSFLLRIEDTDAERNRPELTDNILEMLRWLGLNWDAEPVYQSERGDRYAEAATKLAASGAAYACDCTSEQVQARARERGGAPGYDGHCRDRGLEPGLGLALRLRVPHDDGAVAWTDLIRGEIRFEHRNLEDAVLVRSSGAPTFLLANAVDDLDMGITHVIRGEDHVNSTPKYLLIRAALGAPDVPVFAHLPLLVNEARKKLSKRRDDVSVADYRARGFLPEAMANYMALLGWGPPDGVEVRPIEEIVKLFELADVNAAPAFFDVKKLTHINGEYVRAMPTDAFVEAATPFLGGGDEAVRALRALAPLVQERVKTLAEADQYVDFLYLDEPPVDEAAWDKAVVRGKAAPEMLDATIAGLEALDEGGWTAAAIRQVVEAATVALGFVNAEGRPQLAKTQGPVRVATTGRAVGPPLFEALEVLGRDATLARLRAARSKLDRS
jgi:glutamyl-tRNA synthetase